MLTIQRIVSVLKNGRHSDFQLSYPIYESSSRDTVLNFQDIKIRLSLSNYSQKEERIKIILIDEKYGEYTVFQTYFNEENINQAIKWDVPVGSWVLLIEKVITKLEEEILFESDRIEKERKAALERKEEEKRQVISFFTEKYRQLVQDA